MTPAQLIAWRKATHRTQQEAATVLGMQLRQYQRLEKGETPVRPLYVRVVQEDATARGVTIPPT